MMQLVPAFLRSGHGRDKDQPREPPHPERDDDKQGWDDEREDRDDTGDDLEESDRPGDAADLPGNGGTDDR